jgi:predicted nucleic acid-binding protein
MTRRSAPQARREPALDAGAVYAQADRANPHHAVVAEILLAERQPLITSAVTVAEADYLILTRLGVEVELAFLEDLAEGTGDCRAGRPPIS